MTQCPYCKQFILSPREEEIRAFVKSRRRTTSPDLAKKLGISLSNASSQLKKLAILGFIWREKRTARSGGVEWVYYRVKP